MLHDSIYDKESKSIKQCIKDGLNVIYDNADARPEDVIIQLAEPITVKPIPYGSRAGEQAVWIRVSFSPLSGFPHDHPDSIRDDPDGLQMTVAEIVSAVNNKAPNTVYILGGEPMFKYNQELCHLVAELSDNEKTHVIIETSGIQVPEHFRNPEFCPYFLPCLVIKPQIDNPVTEDEWFPYLQWLVDALAMYISSGANIEFVFELDTAYDIGVESQVVKAMEFMDLVWEKTKESEESWWSPDLERIVFVQKNPGHRPSIDDYEDIRSTVDRLLLNFKSQVAVQIPLPKR